MNVKDMSAKENTKPKYNTYITELAVCQNSENPVFGELVTKVRLKDEAAGMFLEIVQEGNDFNGYKQQVIRLEFDELKEIAEAANILETYSRKFSEIEKFEKESKIESENQVEEYAWNINSGVQPVEDDVLVEVQYRNGDTGTEKAFSFRWNYATYNQDPAYDIFKWRKVK